MACHAIAGLSCYGFRVEILDSLSSIGWLLHPCPNFLKSKRCVAVCCRSLGSRIESAERPPCKLRPILLRPRIDAFDRRVRGKRIVDVGRRGKRVMIGLEDVKRS